VSTKSYPPFPLETYEQLSARYSAWLTGTDMQKQPGDANLNTGVKPLTENKLSPSSARSGVSVDYAIGDIDSDKPGTGARTVDGKPDYSLLPLTVLEPVVRVWEQGQEKYKAWNWAKGMPWSVPLSCLMRHLSAYQAGETFDDESGQSHMAHIICNAMMLLHYERAYTDGDDRPTHFKYEDNQGSDDA